MKHPDTPCIKWVHSNCHKLITSPALAGAYWQILHERADEQRSHYPNLARLVHELLLIPAKCQWVEETPVPGEEMMHKEEDRFMPRLAYGRAVIIVSNSRGDRYRLKAWARLHANTVKVLSPESGIRQAQKPC